MPHPYRLVALLIMLSTVEAAAYEETDAKSGKTKTVAPLAPAAAGDEGDVPVYFEEEPEPEAAGLASSGSTVSARPARADRPVGVTGALGFGSGSFYGRLALSYGLLPYVFTDVSGFYQSKTQRSYQGEAYGGEWDLVLRLNNRTMFTPYLGAGPGFEVWKQEFANAAEEHSQSWTGSYFFGLLVAFTKHFGMTVERREKRYFYDYPQNEDGSENPRGKQVASIDVGFQVMF